MPFFEPVWYNRVLVNWPRAHCRVLHLTEASYLGPDSPRTSPRNETVKQRRRQMTVAISPVQWPSWTWCRKWWNHSWHSSRVTLNQRCFAFIRPRTPLVYRYHVISQTQSHSLFLVAPHWDECLEHLSRVVTLLTMLTVEQLLYWSDWICTGRAAQIEAKTKFRFGNIVPKQWTLSGFIQHTTVLTQCTKTITRLVGNKKCCIWIKCLNMCHIFKRVLA